MDGGAVYLIQNLVNGKRYVGQTTKTVKGRFEGHARCKKTLIGKAIRKYGKKNFRYGIIKTCATKAELDYWEKYFIAALKSKVPYGYNIADGGDYAHAPQSLKLMSEKQLGKEIPDEQRKNHSVIIRSKTEPTYPILEAELTRQGVMYVDLVKHLDLSKQSITDRMNGTKNFWLEEATAVRELLNVDMPLEELFQTQNGEPPVFKTPPDYLYPVLSNELRRRKISNIDLAKNIGMSKAVLYNIMHDKKAFTLEQMTAIKNFLGVDMPLEELFRRAHEPVPKKRRLKRRNWGLYPVLEAELQRQGLSATPVAKYIGINVQSFSNKMRGEHRFFPNEMEATKEFLGVDIPIEELFRRADGKVYREKEPFYPVLRALLEQKKIFHKDIAEFLGIAKVTVARKLNNRSTLTLAEMEAIKKFLNTELSIEELFKRNDTD